MFSKVKAPETMPHAVGSNSKVSSAVIGRETRPDDSTVLGEVHRNEHYTRLAEIASRGGVAWL